MAEWKSICKLDDIPRLGSRIVRSMNGDIALFRTSSDEVFALRDRCPHKGGPLSQGLVHGNQVTCPLHGWRLRLDSGEAVAPDQGCSRRYPIRIESGTVFLDI
ncbi:MAG: Assimilatory nitrite reductase [NAD(P)H] small subunit [Candidatus Accumulibacter regalis]|jgi:nitrite reductase (NADH) small subunit|uniref:Assimilatory nitrite reductase [NAD(P)H] small subunit n=1 Tax=Accumulibacter regalis TaxID=522306 RepID=A0A011RHT6_ACCRE|nr:MULTISPECIES: nitrite reductase small subunit NirD [unclassified Candidatus Accumulibacter]EXI90764.1 MAG: Assimilatory nitrite reductase [NAD(P)H] small subunit [Candidatus Accumulibacter regalis]MQM33588.1 nitrite reductase (NAD(P)H) small subunit [Candidatus Accumulibacter phosphatis]MBL8367852.1 nitrite reductase small subunit NirD [Accumulibacter sp.]MBN8514442.1 nitrite reductase small subunit NirD [Accumulibacter sp.]HRE69064.1 nitrite reductase small subunit NirD [Accumulibacter sp.